MNQTILQVTINVGDVVIETAAYRRFRFELCRIEDHPVGVAIAEFCGKGAKNATPVLVGECPIQRLTVATRLGELHCLVIQERQYHPNTMKEIATFVAITPLDQLTEL